MERLAAYNIVPAGPGDAAALARVHVRSWRETYAGLLPGSFLAAMNTADYARRWRRQLMTCQGAEVVLCAEGVGGLVGYCAASTEGALSEVSTLYIIRPAQRRGLGRRLLASAAQVGRANGARALQLWVLEGNARARSFYEHLGGAPGDHRSLGHGGSELSEIAYRWNDIRQLSGS